METKKFPVQDVLSVAKGKMLSTSLSGIQDICGYMLGTEIYTSQIPAALRICMPEILRQYPYFSEIDFNAQVQDFDNWISEMQQTFGAEIPIMPSTPNEHSISNPIQAFRDIRENPQQYTKSDN